VEVSERLSKVLEMLVVRNEQQVFTAQVKNGAQCDVLHNGTRSRASTGREESSTYCEGSIIFKLAPVDWPSPSSSSSARSLVESSAPDEFSRLFGRVIGTRTSPSVSNLSRLEYWNGGYVVSVMMAASVRAGAQR